VNGYIYFLKRTVVGTADVLFMWRMNILQHQWGKWVKKNIY